MNEIFPYLPHILFLNDLFPPTLRDIFEILPLHLLRSSPPHRLEVLSLSGTQNCGFFSLKNELLLCHCRDAPLPLPLCPGFGSFGTTG